MSQDRLAKIHAVMLDSSQQLVKEEIRDELLSALAECTKKRPTWHGDVPKESSRIKRVLSSRNLTTRMPTSHGKENEDVQCSGTTPHVPPVSSRPVQKSVPCIWWSGKGRFCGHRCEELRPDGFVKFTAEGRSHYPSLVAVIVSRLESRREADLHRMKLPNRVRRREESLPELAENIERLARLANLEASIAVLERQEGPIHRCSVRCRISPKAKNGPTRMIRSRNWNWNALISAPVLSFLTESGMLILDIQMQVVLRLEPYCRRNS